jgi:2,3-bisphosphoglycerate-dependent phosphoglycerate mutase
VFVSDLRRAEQTAEIAFAGSSIPILRDARLREVDHGQLTGMRALDHLLHGIALDDLVDAPFDWQEGWSYTVPT